MECSALSGDNIAELFTTMTQLFMGDWKVVPGLGKPRHIPSANVIARFAPSPPKAPLQPKKDSKKCVVQ
jgi:hypothetical protein